MGGCIDTAARDGRGDLVIVPEGGEESGPVHANGHDRLVSIDGVLLRPRHRRTRQKERCSDPGNDAPHENLYRLDATFEQVRYGRKAKELSIFCKIRSGPANGAELTYNTIMRLYIGSLLILCAALAHAAVTRVEVTGRTDIPGYNYERLTGKVYFAVDPKLAANRRIADIDLAPRNEKGLVEFSSDMTIFRPKDGRGNGTALMEITNRGGLGSINSLHIRAAGSDEFGDGFLFEQGFTLVLVGWEWDIPEGRGLKLHAPVAKQVTGPVLAEIMVDKKSTSESLGDRAMIAYTAADTASAQMTVRDTPTGARKEIPRREWHLDLEGT